MSKYIETDMFFKLACVQAHVEDDDYNEWGNYVGNIMKEFEKIIYTFELLCCDEDIMKIRDKIDLIKDREKARKKIIKYIEKHGNKIIIPYETWEVWNIIIKGPISDNIVEVKDVTTSPIGKNITVEITTCPFNCGTKYMVKISNVNHN